MSVNLTTASYLVAQNQRLFEMKLLVQSQNISNVTDWMEVVKSETLLLNLATARFNLVSSDLNLKKLDLAMAKVDNKQAYLDLALIKLKLATYEVELQDLRLLKALEIEEEILARAIELNRAALAKLPITPKRPLTALNVVKGVGVGLVTLATIGSLWAVWAKTSTVDSDRQYQHPCLDEYTNWC